MQGKEYIRCCSWPDLPEETKPFLQANFEACVSELKLVVSHLQESRYTQSYGRTQGRVPHQHGDSSIAVRSRPARQCNRAQSRRTLSWRSRSRWSGSPSRTMVNSSSDVPFSLPITSLSTLSFLLTMPSTVSAASSAPASSPHPPQ